MRRWGIACWYAAFGAAAVASGALVLAHVFVHGWTWLRTGPVSWTIYPPLSALPQAMPGLGEPDPFEQLIYQGLVAAGAFGAGVVLLCWLLAWGLLRRYARLRKALFRPWWGLVVLLLLPLVHAGRMGYDIFKAETEPPFGVPSRGMSQAYSEGDTLRGDAETGAADEPVETSVAGE